MSMKPLAPDPSVPAGVTPHASAPPVRPGIETFLADVPQALRGKRVGLITNNTGIDRSATPDIDLLAKHPQLGRAAAREISKARLVELPNVGHIPHIEAQQPFHAAVLDFLKP